MPRRAPVPVYPSFRRPTEPRPIEAIEVPHPDLPEALDGLTILHLTDLHARQRPHTGLPLAFSRLLSALAATPVDLIALTGDLMNDPGHEKGGLSALSALIEAWHAAGDGSPRLGAYGIFGNHDTFPFARAARALPGIRWLQEPGLGGEPASVCVAQGRLELLGLSWPEDPVAAVLGAPVGALRPGESDRPFRVALAHVPSTIVPAAALGLPLVLAGHTHGGQLRLSPRHAPYTACDMPSHLASGMLRLGDTLCCVSRGLGDGVMQGLRIRCPHQAPLYTLRRAPLPPLPRGADPGRVWQVSAW